MTHPVEKRPPCTEDPKAHPPTARHAKHKLSYYRPEWHMNRCSTLLYLCPQLIHMNPATMY